MKIQIELGVDELRKMVLIRLQELLGELPLNEKDVKIETKSKQNYRSEWEVAEFRARIEVEKVQ